MDLLPITMLGCRCPSPLFWGFEAFVWALGVEGVGLRLGVSLGSGLKGFGFRAWRQIGTACPQPGVIVQPADR